jgi:hypothetical protein
MNSDMGRGMGGRCNAAVPNDAGSAAGGVAEQWAVSDDKADTAKEFTIAREAPSPGEMPVRGADEDANEDGAKLVAAPLTWLAALDTPSKRAAAPTREGAGGRPAATYDSTASDEEAGAEAGGGGLGGGGRRRSEAEGADCAANTNGREISGQQRFVIGKTHWHA